MKSTYKNLISVSTTFGLVAMGLASFPTSAVAQDSGANGQTSADASNPNGPMINKFDLEDVDLYTAFTLLFTQAKVNYTLDPSLRQHTISIHQRTPTRFRQLLEVMLNYSTAHGLPLTYTVEDGYYNIVPKMETTDNSSSSSSSSNEVAPPTWNKPYHMPLSTFNFNPEFLISIFGGRRIYAASGLNTQGAGYGSGGMGGGMMGGGMGGGMMGGGMGGGMMGGGMGGGMMGGGMGGGMMGGGMMGGGMGGGMMGGGMMGGGMGGGL